AVAVTHATTINAATPSSSPTATAATPAGSAHGPTYTVTSSTELPWDLAETYLGNGQRWQDIAALNPNVPGLASGDQYLPQGAILQLPLDARLPTDPTKTPTPTHADGSPTENTTHPTSTDDEQASAATPSSKLGNPRHEHVTVAPGDSLWTIAGDEYGNPTAWTAIYKANKGEAQPGGGHFADPDLIFPGQKLDLPRAEAHPAAPGPSDTESQNPDTSARHAKPSDSGPAPTAPTTDEQNTLHDQQQAPLATTPSTSEITVPPAGPSRTPDPTDTSRPAQTSAEPAHADQDSENPYSPVIAWTGTGIVAAALVNTLFVRRRRQQHRRRPGRRIAMPTGRTAATEQGMRRAQEPTGFTLLNTALRCLAGNLRVEERDLPTLHAAVLHESRLELHLAEEAPPCTPFTAAPDRQDLWTCSANHLELVDDTVQYDVGAPYPALVSIGWDPHGNYVLVDLEHIGILHLDGNPDFARHILQAIAVEFANTPVAGHLEVTALGQTLPCLETAVPERVARAQDIHDATAEIVAHADDQRRALSTLGVDSPRAARLRDDTGGDWTPHILLAEQLPDEPETGNLLAALCAVPGTASAVITASTLADLPDHAWVLSCQNPGETVILPGSGLPVRLQALDDDHFNDAIELLTTADSDRDAPAPEWMRPDSTAPIAGDEGARDGLPDEYRHLEQEFLDGQAPPPTADGASAPPRGTSDMAPASNHRAESLADVLGLDGNDPADEEPAESTEIPPGPTTTYVSKELAELTADNKVSNSPSDSATEAHARRDKHTNHVPDSGHYPNPLAPIPALGQTAENTDPMTPGPAVLLLGPITIEGATGRVDSNRKSVATELIAFLALTPGSDHHAVDAALWPSSRINKEMRNSVISRARSWLGTDADGNQHLPRVQNTPDKRYRLGPHVTCDWLTFQRYARHGLTDYGQGGDLALCRALALVRGRPFAGMDPQRYAWAEPIVQEMVSAITDVASELSTRRREVGDIPGALWAAHQGLLAVEESETLYRALFLAHHAAGDINALRAAAARLRRINDSIAGGVEMETDTAELLRNLLPRPIHAR
ncbi:LysM peptidoglycan-binding domain-containing protein, partial [Streptomyces sp. NPDC004230]